MFKFNRKSDFTMMKFFCKLPLKLKRNFCILYLRVVRCRPKKFTFAISSPDESLVISRRRNK